MRHLCFVPMACVFCAMVSAAEPAQENPLRTRRMELLESRTAELDLRFNEENARPLSRGKTPLLRWSNPVRQFVNDGVTFLWLEGNRPLAVISCWARSNEADLAKGELVHEFVTLSGSPLVLRRGREVIWSPQPAEVVDHWLADAPPPQATAVRRLAQMREIARRFQATSYKMESPFELRLLTQPLYRYEDERAGILDGALFAFTEGNDPEALLLVEAAARDGRQDSAWRYSVARMTSFRVTVRLENREVFSVAPYWKGPRSPNDPYVEASDGPFALEDAASPSK